MFSFRSPREKIVVIAVFAVAMFSAATVAYDQKTRGVRADTISTADPKNVNPIKRLALADEKLTSQPVTTEIAVSPSSSITAAPAISPELVDQPSALQSVQPPESTGTTSDTDLSRCGSTGTRCTSLGLDATPSPSETNPLDTASPRDEIIPTTNSTEPTSAKTKPFYTDLRYLLLIFNGVILFSLAVTLIVRVASKLFTQPGMQQPIDLSHKPTEPITVDQLDVDIPL